MSLKRQLQRKNLKEKSKQMENIIRNGGRDNMKLDMEARYLQEKLANMQTELKVAKDIIAAMAINDIRNHNFTGVENKKQVSISYQFLIEVSQKYNIDVKHLDDMLVIVPVKVEQIPVGESVKDGKGIDSEGVDGDEGADGKSDTEKEDSKGSGNEKDCDSSNDKDNG